MRRALKVASSLGSAALILSGAASAAGPIPFDQWQVVNGEIRNVAGDQRLENVPCAAGFNCGAAMADAGFFQREITRLSDGVRFFQTIVTETGATGQPGTGQLSFADENYVRINPPGQPAVSGLADRQQVADAPNGFSTSATINVGWAAVGEALTVQISQDVVEPNGEANGVFSSSFDIGMGPGGRSMDMNQNVELTQNPGAIAANSPQAEFQRFALRDRLGASPAGNFTLPGGLTLAHAAGQPKRVTWIGQLMPVTGQNFGFMAFAVNPDNPGPADRISFFSTAEAGPFNWAGSGAEPVFGPAPAF